MLRLTITVLQIIWPRTVRALGRTTVPSDLLFLFGFTIYIHKQEISENTTRDCASILGFMQFKLRERLCMQAALYPKQLIEVIVDKQTIFHYSFMHVFFIYWMLTSKTYKCL